MNKVKKDLHELVILSVCIPVIIGAFIRNEELFFIMFVLFFVYSFFIKRLLFECDIYD